MCGTRHGRLDTPVQVALYFRAVSSEHRVGVEPLEGHEVRGSVHWLEDLRRDVAYGVRTLLRTPGFTLVAVLTLALGISAVTVIYSVLRNVALDPFPYSRSDRLVNVVLRDGSGRISAARISAPRSSSTIRSKPPRSRTSSAPASSARTG